MSPKTPARKPLPKVSEDAVKAAAQMLTKR